MQGGARSAGTMGNERVTVGWRCRKSMGGGYRGRRDRRGTTRPGGAGDAEIAWEEAPEEVGQWKIELPIFF